MSRIAKVTANAKTKGIHFLCGHRTVEWQTAMDMILVKRLWWIRDFVTTAWTRM